MPQTHLPIDSAIARRHHPVLTASSPTTAPQSLPDPAIVVGLALMFARLQGRKRAALPFIIAEWLVELADHGDPICRLVLDWLAGDVPDLSRDVTAGARTHEVSGMSLIAHSKQQAKAASSIQAAAADENEGSF